MSGDVPVYDYLSRDALLEEAEHGQYTVLRVQEDMKLLDFNVAVAASITSYARIRLWALMDAIAQVGGRVFSCDTDSITTDLDLSMHPKIMAEFIPDYESDSPGAALGSLKDECGDELVKHMKKNGVVDPVSAMELERGSKTWRPIPFEHPGGTLCNSANKMYALRTVCKSTGKTLEICKAKDMSGGLHGFDDYSQMFGESPKPMQCVQKQFRMPMSGYCRDGGIQPVTLKSVPKTANAQYSKGRIAENGCISPFEI